MRIQIGFAKFLAINDIPILAVYNDNYKCKYRGKFKNENSFAMYNSNRNMSFACIPSYQL